ncbi:ribokinase [Brucella endophytica]|uniref:Ribokinase n=1 Tax=Brucella endophytica TaxID=1963359 RepID=A0A916SK62_9HYPH|nr:ribokinase [Brucella endophytica]GGB04214.1 ribokinase [Brucella endophytica]
MIVTFGSINCDFIFTMQEMPEPGQTLLAKNFRVEAGGKGANQALAAARDGAEVVMVGAVGHDELAATAMQNLVESGVDIRHVARLPVPTGCASIFIDAEGRNMIAVASGANLAAKSMQVDDALLFAASIVLMQMENDPEEIAQLIRRAHQAGKKSILNLAPACRLGAELLSLCSLIIVNEDEAVALAGWLNCTSTAETLSKASGTGIMRTLGGEGAEAYVEGEYIPIPAIKVDVVDTTAAGDCFIGVLAAGMDRGLSLNDAMRRASVAAALACSHRGSQASIPFASDTNQTPLARALSAVL